jgi:type I restriction enzyme, S subunit
MSHYQPYPKYKLSGVEWLGEVPEGWEVKPLKTATNLLTKKSEGRRNAIGLENIESWSGRYIETETEFDGEGVAVEAGDILFGKLRPYLAKALLVTEPSDAVGDFHAMRPQRETHAQFLLYQILSKEFIVMVDGSTFGSKMPRASWEFVGKMPLPLPPLPEQVQIAAFLDRECGKLDALQAKQERLIELLKEKRQALISHAVTRGLDPTTPLKPSGIEWLGDVPEHWEVIKMMMILKQSPRNGVSPPITSNGTTPTFSISAVRNGRVNISENLKEAEIDSKQAAAFLVMRGDVLTLRGNGNRTLVGTAGIVDKEPPEGCIFPDILMRLRPTRRITPELLVLFLNSDAIRPAIELAAQTASGVWKISGSSLSSIKLPLPPLAEQHAIVAHLDEKCGKIDQLKAKAERAIELLKERRSALISAAVTGKIDVRGGAV